MIITTNIFQGELTIGQITDPVVSDKVQLFIDEYEPEFLKKLLQNNLYNAFIDGLSQDPIEQRWIDLKETVTPMIACYVYYWYMRNSKTQTMGIGEVRINPELSTNINPSEKMAFIWNKMVDKVIEFIKTLDKTVYPEYNNNYGCYLDADIIHKINTFDI